MGQSLITLASTMKSVLMQRGLLALIMRAQMVMRGTTLAGTIGMTNMGHRDHAETVAAHAGVAAVHGAESDIPLAEQYNPNRRKPSYYFHTATTKSGEAARSFLSASAANV